MSELFDVVRVDLATKKVALMAVNKSERNAEAIVDMAVIRRGVDDCFYTTVPNGKYHEGDTYEGGEGA